MRTSSLGPCCAKSCRAFGCPVSLRQTRKLTWNADLKHDGSRGNQKLLRKSEEILLVTRLELSTFSWMCWSFAMPMGPMVWVFYSCGACLLIFSIPATWMGNKLSVKSGSLEPNPFVTVTSTIISFDFWLCSFQRAVPAKRREPELSVG